MKTIILLVVCILTIVAYAGSEKCLHYCDTCGCDYSAPAYCYSCPVLEDANGWSHWRKISHNFICDVCRDHEHDYDGAGELGDDDAGMHELYECPLYCHGDHEYDDGYLIERAY